MGMALAPCLTKTKRQKNRTPLKAKKAAVGSVDTQTADYIRQLSFDLAAIARGRGFDTAAYLLDMVVLTLVDIIDAPPKPEADKVRQATTIRRTANHAS